MKKTANSFVLLVALLSACIYDFPITEKHVIPFDSALLGNWEWVPTEPDDTDDWGGLRMRRFSDTEILVLHYDEESEMYFRAYAFEIEGTSGLQLEFLGDDHSPVEHDGENRYSVVSYEIDADEITVKWLNTDLVDEDLGSGEALRQIVVENKDRRDLFTEPVRFKKIEPEPRYTLKKLLGIEDKDQQ